MLLEDRCPPGIMSGILGSEGVAPGRAPFPLQMGHSTQPVTEAATGSPHRRTAKAKTRLNVQPTAAARPAARTIEARAAQRVCREAPEDTFWAVPRAERSDRSAADPTSLAAAAAGPDTGTAGGASNPPTPFGPGTTSTAVQDLIGLWPPTTGTSPTAGE